MCKKRAETLLTPHLASTRVRRARGTLRPYSILSPSQSAGEVYSRHAESSLKSYHLAGEQVKRARGAPRPYSILPPNQATRLHQCVSCAEAGERQGVSYTKPGDEAHGDLTQSCHLARGRVACARGTTRPYSIHHRTRGQVTRARGALRLYSTLSARQRAGDACTRHAETSLNLITSPASR